MLKTPLITVFFGSPCTYLGKVRKIKVTSSSSFCWRASQKSRGNLKGLTNIYPKVGQRTFVEQLFKMLPIKKVLRVNERMGIQGLR